jgi:CRISPR-associated endonuclease/helicase Cas3
VTLISYIVLMIAASRVDFSSYEARCLAARWDSPIVVTTAVQFFETLAARDTASLRKLHQVAGSAIFVDEAHAAVPPALWPQMFRWLRELCEDWGCQLVLASGTLPRFWNRPGFLQEGERCEIPDLIKPEVRAETMTFEEKRVAICREAQAMSVQRLGDFVHNKPGPRLVIFNTVQSAAVFAHYLREDCKRGSNVEHISTALTPRDRANTVRRVKENLASGWNDWTLVATSCVEAGVDFSFRTAFRESWGLAASRMADRRLQIADRSQWPDWRELMLGSVQLWTGKEREFALPELRGLPGVFRWNLEYNPFLGYMAGVLPLLKAGKAGFEPL